MLTDRRSSSSVRLTDQQRQVLNSTFGSITQAVTTTAMVAENLPNLSKFFPDPAMALAWTVEMFPVLVHHTWDHLSGVFHAGELQMILDVLNGSGPFLGHHASAGTYLVPNVIDSFALYPGVYEQKWGVVKKDITEKLWSLTLFERVAMELWASYYWGSKDLNQRGHTERFMALLGA